MTTYDERERAFEAAFAHDQELQFKAQARRDHKLGLWAAGLLGKSGAAAEAYAQSVIDAGLAEPGDNDVVAFLTRDFAAAGVAQSTAEINRKLNEYLAIAVQEIRAKP